MKQDNIVVRSNPSLAFMLTLYHWNYMNAIFLQLKGMLSRGKDGNFGKFSKLKFIN